MGDLLVLIINLINSLSERGKSQKTPVPYAPPPLPQSRIPPAPTRIAGPTNAQRSSNPSSVLNAPAMRQMQRRAKPAARVPAARVPVAPPLPAAPRAAAMAAAPAATVNRGRSGDAPVVTASVIRRWATPTRLQQQFILTEIFQPPLALRMRDE
jgi:hypothetical protein